MCCTPISLRHTVISIFCADLADRGIAFTRPDDAFNDEAWSTLLAQTYLIGAFT